MASPVVAAWLASHLLTQGVEVPLAVALLARTGAPAWRRGVASALGTLVMHPILWFVWPRVVADPTLGLASGELLVLGVEAVLLWRLVPAAPRDALAASALANAASYLVGLALR